MADVTVYLPDRGDLRDLIARALPAAGVAAVSVITRRTAQGIDVNGVPFRPYTPRYARDKALTGRRAVPPDLTLTGQMLRNLKVKTPTSPVDATFGRQGPEVRIGFDGQHRNTQIAAVKRKSPVASSTTSRRDLRGKVLKRLARTTPMATVVAANHRRRPFVGIRTPRDVETVARAFGNALNAEIRRRNEQARREANTASVAALARR